MVVDTAIAQQWEIQLRNPDAPYEAYHYPYYLRSAHEDWDEFLGLLTELSADRFVLVSEDTLPAHLASVCAERLSNLAPCTRLTFPGGEASKNLATVSELGNDALAAGITRASVMVALGGGVAGNVAGLLAGLCLRGLRWVSVPTTLLAQSDSCLSLKQGVNSAHGKNHLGLFSAPQFVWSHLSFLETLPEREIRAALCELVKNVLALRPDRFDEVLTLLRPDARYSASQLARVIALCVEAKTSIMANDALEKHEALALEYGHTVGHAIELLSRGALSHGEAIGIGMVVEAELSHRLGLLSAADVQLHYTLLHANGAPTAIPAGQSVEQLLAIMRRDNKRGYLPPEEGTIDLVLLEGLGRPRRCGQTLVTHVAEQEVRAALARCQLP